MGSSNKHKEGLSLLILIFLILIIFLSLYYFSRVENEEQVISSVDAPFDPEYLKTVANTSLEVVKILSRGGIISDGPREATIGDREKYPSIFASIEGKTYLMEVEGSQNKLIILMNSSAVLKTVPISQFS